MIVSQIKCLMVSIPTQTYLKSSQKQGILNVPYFPIIFVVKEQRHRIILIFLQGKMCNPEKKGTINVPYLLYRCAKMFPFSWQSVTVRIKGTFLGTTICTTIPTCTSWYSDITFTALSILCLFERIILKTKLRSSKTKNSIGLVIYMMKY